MKKGIKNFIGILLTATLMFTVFAPTVFAADALTVENFYDDYNRYTGAGGDVVIPTGIERVENYCFSRSAYSEEITSVTIPDSVTSIGVGAFSECSNLTSVNIPASVYEIDQYAFGGCTSLTSVVIPEGITVISGTLFDGCTSLTDITIPKSVTEIRKQAFCGTPFLENFPGDFVIINNILVKYKGTASDVVIPDGVTVIAAEAFYESDVTSVVIPEGVTLIGGAAFAGCTNLTKIKVPTTLCDVDGGYEMTFEGCPAAKQVEADIAKNNGDDTLLDSVIEGVEDASAEEIGAIADMAEEEPDVSTAKKANKTSNIVLPIVIVAVVIIGGVTAFVVIKKKKTDE